MTEIEQTTEQHDDPPTDLDKIISYCGVMAREARRAKGKGSPAVLQALSLHRIACALEDIQDDVIEEVGRQGARAGAGDDELPDWGLTEAEIEERRGEREFEEPNYGETQEEFEQRREEANKEEEDLPGNAQAVAQEAVRERAAATPKKVVTP